MSVLPILSHDSQTPPVRDKEYQSFLATLPRGDRLALAVTKRVGTFQFFLGVVTWTLVWCGYNILAAVLPQMHWKPFDPFPAFVAWLLLSNVLQLCLMPMILIGQNLDSQRADAQAKADFAVNRLAEEELRITEAEVKHLVNCVEALMQSMKCVIPERVHHVTCEEDIETLVHEY